MAAGRQTSITRRVFRYGQIYGYWESLGIVGVVRAQSWESAYECAQDELMDDCTVECECDIEDWNKDKHSEDCELYDHDGDLHEGYIYRSNGTPANPRLKSPIASYDLNGQALNVLPDTWDDETEFYVIVERDEDNDE